MIKELCLGLLKDSSCEESVCILDEFAGCGDAQMQSLSSYTKLSDVSCVSPQKKFIVFASLTL